MCVCPPALPGRTGNLCPFPVLPGQAEPARGFPLKPGMRGLRRPCCGDCTPGERSRTTFPCIRVDEWGWGWARLGCGAVWLLPIRMHISLGCCFTPTEVPGWANGLPTAAGTWPGHAGARKLPSFSRCFQDYKTKQNHTPKPNNKQQLLFSAGASLKREKAVRYARVGTPAGCRADRDGAHPRLSLLCGEVLRR